MATNSKERQREYNRRRGLQARAYAFIWYPEMGDLPQLVELLDALHLEYLISPLHDSDVDATGQPKKAHYHVMVMWPTSVGLPRATRAFASCGVTAPPEAVDTVRGYARYLIHLDDHDKHRYDDRDVIAGGGAVWADVALDPSDATERVLDEVIDWLHEQGVDSYYRLCLYVRACRPEWKHVVYRNTLFLKEFMRSMEYERRRASREDYEQCSECGAWVPKSEIDRGGCIGGPEGHIEWAACPDCSQAIHERLESLRQAEQGD